MGSAAHEADREAVKRLAFVNRSYLKVPYYAEKKLLCQCNPSLLLLLLLSAERVYRNIKRTLCDITKGTGTFPTPLIAVTAVFFYIANMWMVQ